MKLRQLANTEADPGAAVDELLMRIPVEDREDAFRQALRVCLYVANEERIIGSHVPGLEDW